MIIEETKIFKYVADHKELVFKEPRKFIKYPFIDPGSVYDGNVWDWDTYWSVYGLMAFAKHFKDKAFNEKLKIHAIGNVMNFLDHQLEDGYIPMMIEVADWDEPYLNMKHKEGTIMNMHKPFLCQQIELISDFFEDYSWIKDYTNQLHLYFEHYEKVYFFEDKGLYVWCDDIMIGMDNDPASFGRPKFSTANIFLNAFMVMELASMIHIMEVLTPDDIRIKTFKDKRKALINTINTESWDKRDRFYYSVDVDIKTRPFEWIHEGLGVFWKTLPIKIRAWSGFIPLLAGIPSKEQGKALLNHALDEKTFKSPFGICSLAKDEKMFDLSVTNNPSNWLGPIWLVVNYVVFKGLLDYGYLKEAKDICQATLNLLEKDLEMTQSMHEYYNPFDGSPIMNGGFLNWNILALNMLDDLNGL